MSTTYSVLERSVNALIAPLRVLKDKVYDATTKNPDTNEIIRLYPKNIICEYTTFFSGPTQVHPHIFLGSAYNAASFQTLVDNNIKYIINVTNEISNYYPDYFTYYQIPMKDNNVDSISKYLDDSYTKITEYINNNDGNILVHCYMGASRSAVIVANFIHKNDGGDIQLIIDQLREKRPNVNPTHKFLTDLQSISN